MINRICCHICSVAVVDIPVTCLFVAKDLACLGTGCGTRTFEQRQVPLPYYLLQGRSSAQGFDSVASNNCRSTHSCAVIKEDLNSFSVLSHVHHTLVEFSNSIRYQLDHLIQELRSMDTTPSLFSLAIIVTIDRKRCLRIWPHKCS
jgi:hypothetical protein